MIGEIIKVKQETPDVKTFRLKLEHPIKFISGQFCLVSCIGKKICDGEDRPFTFASSPTEKEIELTVKIMGKYTRALDSLTAGDKFNISQPSGTALNFDETVKEDVVFIAGGSGVTPFMSAIRYAIKKQLPNKMTLLFSNRKKEDIIFRQELDNLPDNIKVIYTLTNEQWDGESGRVSIEMLRKYVDNPGDKLWYICGPPPMVQAMKELLFGMGIIEKNIRMEGWQLPGKHDGMS